MENVDIARALNEVADLLDIQGANPFRVRSYRSAAQFIEGYSEPLARLVRDDADLTRLPYIGKDMAGYIAELVETGQLGVLEELRAQVPQGVREMLELEAIGPKRAAALWQQLEVRSLADLEREAQAGHVAGLRGFGKRTEQRILEQLRTRTAGPRRVLLVEADQYVRSLLDHMRTAPGLDRLEVAGSWRRRKETVGDLDLLATTAGEPGPLVSHFTTWPEVTRVTGAGSTRAAVVLRSGLHVDLRVVEPKSFGAAMCYFTGSKAHNIHLRSRAIDRGLHLSEYGVFRGGEPAEERSSPTGARRARPSEGEWLTGRTEEEVYAALGLPWIPPELREDQGEIEAAEAGRLPALVEPKDLRGDLHVHSAWSNDARDPIEAMVEACEARGYAYMAITDHSPTNAGLSGPDLERQWAEIDEVQARHPGIRILKGIEVAILRDGSLDLPDEYLERLDWVVASVHSHFRLPAEEQTRRVVRALEHPCVTVLGHPTARLLNERPPIEVDMEAVLRCAAEQGVAVELDAQPGRLDLPDTHLRRARELGVPVVISSDAHTREGLDVVRYGIDQARRGWLERGDVLNTLPLRRFLAALDRRKARAGSR